jgi:hypothetical protein
VDAWISHPDDVQAKVREWQESVGELLHVDALVQPTGRPVFALTATDPTVPEEAKRKLLAFVPHAHEPAPTAACVNVLNMVLTSRGLDGAEAPFDAAEVRRKLLVTFIPDANPDGTARAPVERWDGSQYTNEEFWAWMRGPDPQTGRMWKRVDLFDVRQEESLPERIGIVYEPISEFGYVEPNRHPRSSLMRHLKALTRARRYDALLDLHQTEFERSDRNCMVILPTTYDEQPKARREEEMALAQEIVSAWREAGGRPIEAIKPLGYTGEQRQYFVDVWGPYCQTHAIVTSEVQNNNPATPPAQQQRLSEIAIATTMKRLLAANGSEQ